MSIGASGHFGPESFAPGGDVRCVRTVTLEPDFASARAARRTLRDALVEADREAWIDTAELAVSEIVANALLHAGTPIEVSIEVRDDVVHVQVRDFSGTLPVLPSYDEQATTGRGMALVAALASDCGIRRLENGGKAV
jgi:anti-sigma regulatory factor (Ser/Thr protein kinase)